MFLRPSNIIDLLLLSTWGFSGSWPPHRPHYIRLLGFFDYGNGVSLISDDSSSPDPFWSVVDVENDVANKLTSVSRGNIGHLIRVWSQYRHDRWAEDARGKVFLDEETDDQIVQCTMNWHEGRERPEVEE